MKRILVFRSSNFNVLKRLKLYIDEKYFENYEIYMVVQNEAYNIVKEEYTDIEFILTDNGFFSYDKYMKNKELKDNIKKVKYDAIYIPSSSVGDKCGKEINLIASDIGARDIFLFDCLGKVYKVNNSKLYTIVRDDTYKIINYFKNFSLIILFEIIYLLCIIYSNIFLKGRK